MKNSDSDKCQSHDETDDFAFGGHGERLPRGSPSLHVGNQNCGKPVTHLLSETLVTRLRNYPETSTEGPWRQFVLQLRQG